MADNINMTVITQPDVSVTVTGFGVKGDKGDAGDPATNLVTSVAGKQGVVVLDKTDVGLSNVENTSDANKPVSTAQQTALNAKANASDTVNLTGDQTVAGVKTFSSSPVVPTATTNTQAVNKAQMDTADALKVNKAGDTMTGTLTLPNSILSSTGQIVSTMSIGLAFSQSRGGQQRSWGVTSAGEFGIWNDTTAQLMLNVLNDRILLGGSTGIIRGTGFPEGVVTANVGSIYIDTAITNGASSWIKKSGTGNTGWVVSVGDTGWRRITSFLNGWTGVLDVRRVNDVLHYRTAYSGATALVGTAATSKVFLAPNTLGSGMFFVGEHRTHNYRPNGAVMGNSYYYHTGWELPAFGTAADVYTFPAGSFFFLDSAWPTTLPGVSV